MDNKLVTPVGKKRSGMDNKLVTCKECSRPFKPSKSYFHTCPTCYTNIQLEEANIEGYVESEEIFYRDYLDFP